VTQARMRSEDCITCNLPCTMATMRLGPRRESRDDYREASVETIERNLFVSFAGALFCKCQKGINRGLGPGEQRADFGRKLAGYDPAAAEVPGLAGPGGFLMFSRA